LDRALQDQLDHYGFSQVLVVHRQMAVLATRQPDFNSIDNHFLPAPVVVPGRGSMPHAAQPAVRHYPRLGISLGFADHEGLIALQSHPEIESIYACHTVGIVRPVRVLSDLASAMTSASVGISYRPS